MRTGSITIYIVKSNQTTSNILQLLLHLASMEEIIHLYDQHLTAPFPNRRGDEILGVDLVLLDSDTAGLIDKYIA